MSLYRRSARTTEWTRLLVVFLVRLVWVELLPDSTGVPSTATTAGPAFMTSAAWELIPQLPPEAWEVWEAPLEWESPPLGDQ